VRLVGYLESNRFLFAKHRPAVRKMAITITLNTASYTSYAVTIYW